MLRTLTNEPWSLTGNAQLPTRLFVIAASKKGCIHMASRTKAGWKSREIPSSVLMGQRTHQILAMSSLGLFLVATLSRVCIFSVESCEFLYTVQTEQMKPRSLQCAYSTQRISHVELPGITSSTISYVSADSGDCILHTFTPPEDVDSICLRAPSGATDGEGCEWSAANVTKRRVKNPGHYGILSDGSAAGIRRKKTPEAEVSSQCGDNGEGLRNRFGGRSTGKNTPIEWEAWTISPSLRTGTDEEQPLFKKGEQPSHLLISDLGPKVRVGLMSVAFSFGNVIKLVTVGGPERFDAGPDETGHEGYKNMASRRRKGGGTWRPRAWT